MHRRASVHVKSNLLLTARARGKIVARREGHNIWLDLGREYLASLLAYRSFNPLAPERDDRIRYMGVGIGGNRQIALAVANGPPVGTAYPGSNLQTDTDPRVTRLERPVRVSGSSDPYPGRAGDVWLGQVQAPATHPIATQVTFKRLFTQLEVSYPPFLSVPLSEIGLFTNAADAGSFASTAVAYDTFDTLSKTDAFELEVVWTVRF
jgi:hypothetical protein